MTTLFILSGFLGSGKTSTLRHVIENLEDAKGTVAVVNEAGELGLDGRLVQRVGIPVHELTNGCVCCSLRVDFVALLEALFKSDPPSRILIEASGLAEPAMLAKTLSRFDPLIKWRKTVVILDAEIWETREVQGDFFLAQLQSADLVLVSKTDLYPADRVEAFVLEIGATIPETPLETVIHGRVDLKLFFEQPKKIKDPELIPESQDLSAYQSFSYESAQSLDEDKWRRFIFERGHEFARIKGQLKLKGGKAYFDFVRGRSNWLPPLESVSGNRLVFVGQNLDPKNLKTRLDNLAYQPGPPAPEGGD
ncbi:MAG: GTP-binding protein [Deltaproteobacteria bacterium]|jgi:G3E family GTPase|nr:GTP-binding protein [Deltaproteobacteria bacterium]